MVSLPSISPEISSGVIYTTNRVPTGTAYSTYIPNQQMLPSVPMTMGQPSLQTRTYSNINSSPEINIKREHTSSKDLLTNNQFPQRTNSNIHSTYGNVPSPSSTSSYLPPLSNIVGHTNRSDSNIRMIPSTSVAVSATFPKKNPQPIIMSSQVLNVPAPLQQQPNPNIIPVPQQATTPIYRGYPTPPTSMVPSPRSFIQPNTNYHQNQYVQLYMVPVGGPQPYGHMNSNQFVPLVPARSLSSPIKSTENFDVSNRSKSNPVPITGSSPTSLPTIIKKSDGKRMIQRQLSAEIRRTKQCPVCGKKCSRPSTLKTHYFIHTGDTPFRCTWPNCTKAFNVKSNMIRHMKSHAKKLASRSIH